MKKDKFSFHPLTMDRWNDFEQLFGYNGACGGCWCMLWRMQRKQFDQNKGDGNRQLMKQLVQSGTVPGLVAYDQLQAIGWIAFAPREEYLSLERSRILKPVDDKQVWSISCFFIHKDYRNRGLSKQLIDATIDYIRSKGGKIVEGYPHEHSQEKQFVPAFVWTGLDSVFRKAGFKEVARRSPTRPIMRKSIRSSSK